MPTFARFFICLIFVSTAMAETTPEAQAAQFYKWYIAGVMAETPLPKLLKAPEMKLYISSTRLAKLHKQLNSPDGMDSDYFLQAQDYLNSWAGNVSVSVVKNNQKKARLRVLIGKGEELNKLAVTSISEHGSWKIDEVKLLE